jgi:hypothetical protein
MVRCRFSLNGRGLPVSKLIAFLIVAAALSGCINNPDRALPPVDVSQQVQVPDGQAAVLVGIRVANPQSTIIFDTPYATGATWVEIDPATGLRVGNHLFGVGMACKIFACKAAEGEATVYQLFLVPPGTYALGWAAQRLSVFEATRFQQLELRIQNGEAVPFAPSLVAKVTPVAPVYTVNAGDVAYVGELTFDFGAEDVVRWSHSYDEAAAHAFMDKTGLADRLTKRPMTRANGQPMGQWDAISNKKS